MDDDAPLYFRAVLETHQRSGRRLHLLTLAGDLDLLSVPELKRVAAAALPIEPAFGGWTDVDVVVDLAGVAFVDISGVTALVDLWRVITRGGGSLGVMRARPQAVRLFKVTGIDSVIPLHGDLAQAISNDHGTA